MTTAMLAAAEALSPMLSVFHSIADQKLEGAWQVMTEGSFAELLLDFGSITLVVRADEADDSIDVTASHKTTFVAQNGLDVSHQEPWSQLKGAAFAWGWVIINQQGYCDGVLLSFGTIIPRVILNVVGSSIKVGVISKPE